LHSPHFELTGEDRARASARPSRCCPEADRVVPSWVLIDLDAPRFGQASKDKEARILAR
jgi:hypothetical protein